MDESPIVFAGLMPHAPILVPGVGGDRIAPIASTMAAMTTVAGRAVSARPDTVVVVSPHSPRRPEAFGVWETPRLRGSLAEFGSPTDEVDLPPDAALIERLKAEASRAGVRVWPITAGLLDHGALVPLCYLVAAGWRGPTVVLSLDASGAGSLETLGQALAAAAQSLHRRVALIASGDMSHRLTPTAPSGFHPEGRRFDERFVALLRAGATDEIGQIDPRLREIAAEDVVESTVVALAAVAGRTDGRDVLSYEGPFGVGYGVAVLFAPGPTGPPVAPAVRLATVLDRLTDLPTVARRAVETELTEGPRPPPFQAAGELQARCGVFVTLRSGRGALRGCIGTLTPRKKDLVGETWSNAVSAAFHDYRFGPLAAAELSQVRFSVTILDQPQPVASPAELNPARYGVIVTAADGRDGVLLPGIAGVNTVDQQVAIVRRKAGIAPSETVALQRFEARSFREPGFIEEEG